MIWRAPSWSDLCPNFMHGFPCRLVSQAHGGFLRGNICANQVVRNVALGDMASFSSREHLTGLGLTVAELFWAWQSAFTYSGKARQPQRLVHTMLRYGVELLTFSPIDREGLKRLSGVTATLHQQRLNYEPAEEDVTSSTESSDESVEVDMERLSRITGAHTQEIREKIHIRFLEDFVGMGTQAPSTAVTVAAAAPRKAVGQWGIRGQVVSGEESERDLTGGSQTASSHHSKRQANPDEARDYPMRQTLATRPGINMAWIPKKFILAHQPISQSVIQLITFKL